MTRYDIGPCPACSHTGCTVIAEREAIRDELEQLWGFHTRRLRNATPVDRLHDRIAFSQDPPLRVVRCAACGLLYRNPREKPEDLVDTYRDERPDSAAMHALFLNQTASYATQAARLTAIAGTAGAGLEVGSYIGAFLAAARDAGWSFTGLDVNQTANAFAASHGFDVRSGTIEEAPDATYNAVVFWNCFDQLPDPRSAAFHARRLLAPGGTVAIRVPNGAFYARWRPLLDSPARALARTLLAHNNLLAFPYRHGFTTSSLRAILRATGFRVERDYGDTLVPIADEWTRRWAALEERAVKAALRCLPPDHAPWLEVYARAV